MLKRFLKNEKGLTLIELLAVVVILGIIAAIAVPAIGKIIDDSRDKAVVSDAQQIINAAKIAKAANTKANKFAGKSGVTDAIELTTYLDSDIDEDVIVEFDGTTWTITGHSELTELNGKLATADKFTNPTPEEELVHFLETGKAK